MKLVKLSPSLWAGLAIVAGARVAKGDEIRSPHQNRGAHRNRLNDLVGCIGEFAAVAASLESNAKVTHDIFDASGPLKREDFTANGKRFDAKGLLLDPSRNYFILDRQSVARAELKGIEAFVPVIARRYGDRALIGNRITIADAKGWGLRDFGYGAAHAMPMVDFAPRYLGLHPAALEQATGLEVFGNGGDSLMEAAFVFGSQLRHAGIQRRIAGMGVIESLESLANEFAKGEVK